MKCSLSTFVNASTHSCLWELVSRLTGWYWSMTINYSNSFVQNSSFLYFQYFPMSTTWGRRLQKKVQFEKVWNLVLQVHVSWANRMRAWQISQIIVLNEINFIWPTNENQGNQLFQYVSCNNHSYFRNLPPLYFVENLIVPSQNRVRVGSVPKSGFVFDIQAK